MQVPFEPSIRISYHEVLLVVGIYRTIFTQVVFLSGPIKSCIIHKRLMWSYGHLKQCLYERPERLPSDKIRVLLASES